LNLTDDPIDVQYNKYPYVNIEFLALREPFMGKIIPFNKEDRKPWKRQNEEVIQKIHDKAQKKIFNSNDPSVYITVLRPSATGAISQCPLKACR